MIGHDDVGTYKPSCVRFDGHVDVESAIYKVRSVFAFAQGPGVDERLNSVQVRASTTF